MKKFIGIASGLAGSLTFALPVFAVEPISECPGTVFSALCGLNAANFGKVLGSLINFIFFASLVLALIFLIYGGVKWLVSGGDKTAVETARNHITAAIIGLVIIFLAYLIINVISFFFLGHALSGINIPKLIE